MIESRIDRLPPVAILREGEALYLEAYGTGVMC